jgi:hypothetical protein
MTPIQRSPPLPQPPLALRKAIAYQVHFLTDVVEENRHEAVAVVRVQIGPRAIKVLPFSRRPGSTFPSGLLPSCP